MQPTDMYVVIAVVAAFSLFAVVLAWVSRGYHNKSSGAAPTTKK